MHDPGSRNCAVFMSYTCINHLQGVAPRSQYSDPNEHHIIRILGVVIWLFFSFHSFLPVLAPNTGVPTGENSLSEKSEYERTCS